MDAASLSSDTASQQPGVKAPLHERIEHALLADDELGAVHVKVQNLSYWYAQRAQLGAQRHLVRYATLNPKTMKWESKIYQMRRSKEDYSFGPQLVFLSTHKSKLQAFRHCEAAAQQRDANPAEKGSVVLKSEDILDSHFRVVVVSDRFRRVRSIERVEMVYAALLRQMGRRPAISTGSLADCLPSYVRGFSTLGNAVAELEFLRYIRGSNELQLVIEAKTPSQWNPSMYPPLESERAGANHLQATSLSIPDYLQQKAQKMRIKMLITQRESSLPKQVELKRSSSLGSNNDRSRQAVQALDLLGTTYVTDFARTNDISKDDYWTKKVGGIYGHFFQDLPADTKKLVLQQFVDREQRTAKAARRKPNTSSETGRGTSEQASARDDTSQASFKPATLPKKRQLNSIDQLKQQFDPQDAGGGTEEEMLEHFQLQSRVITAVATRLQRIWRVRTFCKAARKLWHKSFAVLAIQRVARGVFARAYVGLLRELLPVAATKVQTAWRAFIARRRFQKWRDMVIRAVTKIQPLVRKFLFKCYASWKQRHEKGAVQIQRLCRAFLARVRFYQIAGEAYKQLVIQAAAVTIQRIARGRQGRKLATLALAEKLVLHVDVPAAICIQRVWRGILARTERDTRIMQIGASVQVNRIVRGYLARRWYERVQFALVEQAAAIVIQRRWRGYLDRIIYRYRLRDRHWQTQYLPAVVLVQRIARGNLVRQMVRKKRFQSANATIIQDAFRRMVLRRQAQARWMEFRMIWRHQCATKIQTRFRIVLAKRELINRAIALSGAQYRASRVIMRAWINFRDYRRFSELLFAWRVERYNSILDFLARTRLETATDREEVLRDHQHTEALIAGYKRRVREIRDFQLNAEFRLPKIEEELDNLPLEDLDRGWTEALAAEYTKLTRQMTLSSEELHLKKLQLRQAKDEYEQLQMELEEMDAEMDSICQREIQLSEVLRRMEIREAERLATEHKARKVRYEINRWKVDDVRKNVINRNSKAVQELHKQIKKHRGLDYAMTISYKKKAKQELKERMLKKQMMQQFQQAREHDAIDYHTLMGPIGETYDTVIHNTLNLLQNATLELRERGLNSK